MLNVIGWGGSSFSRNYHDFIEMPHLLCIGLGYTACHLARHLEGAGWQVDSAGRTGADIPYHTGSPPQALLYAVSAASHILVSIPPDKEGCPVWRDIATAVQARDEPVWIGYLSSTAVYGDHQGEWVTEESPCRPSTITAMARYEAEQQWRKQPDTHIFRLAGIYGPGRNALAQAKAGIARRIDAPGKPFSRIHVEDIAQILAAAMRTHGIAGTYNLADDLPAEASDVVAYACELLGMEPPPMEALATAGLSPTARGFYEGAKRVANGKVKKALGITFRYPTYREGLRALQESGILLA